MVLNSLCKVLSLFCASDETVLPEGHSQRRCKVTHLPSIPTCNDKDPKWLPAPPDQCTKSRNNLQQRHGTACRIGGAHSRGYKVLGFNK